MSGNTRRAGGAQSVRGVNYSTSPLLASKTPPWRSRFLVLLVAMTATPLGRWMSILSYAGAGGIFNLIPFRM